MAETSVEVLRGTLDLLILKAVSWGPTHGYAVARWIEGATNDVLQIEEGSLYPALHRLETRELDRGRVGDVGEQPPREVLHPHTQGPRSAPPRDRDVDALRARRLRRARSATTADMTRTPAWRRYLRFWRPTSPPTSTKSCASIPRCASRNTSRAA